MSKLVEALEKTIEIWEWLRDYPFHKTKRAAYLACCYSPDDLHDCPCCQYTLVDKYFDCSNCPIQWVEDYGDRVDLFCGMAESPYTLWDGAKDESERERGAEGVLTLARKALKEAKNDLEM